MLKVDVLATILVQAKWVRDMDEGRAFVANEFRRHRPRQNIAGWNSHVADGWAKAYIAAAVSSRPDKIRLDRAFSEIDNAP